MKSSLHPGWNLTCCIAPVPLLRCCPDVTIMVDYYVRLQKEKGIKNSREQIHIAVIKLCWERFKEKGWGLSPGLVFHS